MAPAPWQVTSLASVGARRVRRRSSCTENVRARAEEMEVGARPGLFALLPKPVVFLVADNNPIRASIWGKFRDSEPVAFAGVGNSSCDKTSWHFNSRAEGIEVGCGYWFPG